MRTSSPRYTPWEDFDLGKRKKDNPTPRRGDGTPARTSICHSGGGRAKGKVGSDVLPLVPPLQVVDLLGGFAVLLALKPMAMLLSPCKCTGAGF